MVEIYDIYHDESKEESYWHGFFFVPRSQRQYLLNLLIEARNGLKWYDFLSFKNIKKDRPKSQKAKLAASWLSIALASIQQQKLFELPTAFFISGKRRKYFCKLNNLIKCKFVIFKERNNHKKMFLGLGKQKCIETTFRIGIKGGIHRLFNDQEPIRIGNIFLDKSGYSFDVNRGLRRFIREKRSYVSVESDAKLILQCSDHRKIKSHQKEEDSQLLQLCDILIGGTRFHLIYPEEIQNIRYGISHPCKYLLAHDLKNYSRMHNSRFENGFTFGQAWLENNKWKFDKLEINKNRTKIQQTLKI